MGFLRNVKFKNLEEVGLAITKLDERISKAEGADGTFKTNKTLDVGKNKIVNLKTPTLYNDAARYSDAMRSKTYSFSVSGFVNKSIVSGATFMVLPWNTLFLFGDGYKTGNPTFDLISYTAPCNLEFKGLYLNAYQLSATLGVGYWVTARIWGGGAGDQLVASCTLPTRTGCQGGLCATKTITSTSKMIAKGNTMTMTILTGTKGCWGYASFIADFLVVDK